MYTMFLIDLIFSFFGWLYTYLQDTVIPEGQGHSKTFFNSNLMLMLYVVIILY